MKRLILILLFSLFAKAGLTQPYRPFPTDTTIWREIKEQHFSPYVERWDFKYTQMGDTTILGKNYHKIYHKGVYANYEEWISMYYLLESGPFPSSLGYVGGIREDSLKHIYFFRGPDYFGVSDTMERLLYDFNLNLGDTLPITYNSDYAVNVVTAIDSISMGGVFHKAFICKDVSWGPPYFALVEGMGSTIGLLEKQVPYFERYENLECFTVMDSTIYENHETSFAGSPYYLCAIPGTVGVDEKSHSLSLEIFPNPTNGLLTLRTESKGETYIEVTDPLGRLIYKMKFSDSESQLDLTSQPKGVYFLRALSGKASSQVYKIILQ